MEHDAGHGRLRVRRQPRHPPTPGRRDTTSARRCVRWTREPAVREMVKDAGVELERPSRRSSPRTSNTTTGGRRRWRAATTSSTSRRRYRPRRPETEDELIRPARDGVLCACSRRARDAKVRRVVMTSSCGAVYYGHPPQHGAVRRNELDQHRRRHERVRAIEGDRRTRGVGLHVAPRRRLARTVRRQPRGHLRTDARRRTSLRRSSS